MTGGCKVDGGWMEGGDWEVQNVWIRITDDRGGGWIGLDKIRVDKNDRWMQGGWRVTVTQQGGLEYVDKNDWWM